MEERFSTYLTEIGILNETDSSSIIKKDDKASNKTFVDSSVECLKNYFDNLDENQKKYMSQYIPSKFIFILDKIKRSKIKSIIIHLFLRQKLILQKYFLSWKKNNYLLSILDNIQKNNIIGNKENEYENEKENSDVNSRENEFNNLANKYINNVNEEENGNNNINENNNLDTLNKEGYKDNIAAYNIVNIDRNVDIDNKNITKTEEEEERMKSGKKSQNSSISFGNIILQKNNNMYKNNIGFKNKNNEFIKKKSNRNKKNNNNNNEKNKININSYQTINTNKLLKNLDKSKYSTNNNKKSYTSNSYRRDIRKKAHLHTSLEEKEMREMNECTFKPKINNKRTRSACTLSQNEINSSLIISNSLINKQKREEEIQSKFEKLYKDSEKYKIAKELKAKEFEKMMSRKTPFIPNIKTNFNRAFNLKRQASEGNFEERQKEYLTKKKKHSAEIKKKINSDFEEICSFNPKITNDKGEYYQIRNKDVNKKPVHIRLYEDCKDRKNNQMQKELENINKIMNLSNFMNPQKNFNFDTINRLYEYKEKTDIINKTRRKVEKDEGITFKPYISENSYIKGINSSFYERGQKLLNDRESFYEEENKKFNDEIKHKVEKKDYTKEERKQIINNIINRLYNVNMKARKNYNNKNTEEIEKIIVDNKK